MNTDYAVGNFRIRFESRARRRWFVALVYTALVVFMLAALFLSHKDATGAWFTASCGIMYIALWIIFSAPWVTRTHVATSAKYTAATTHTSGLTTLSGFSSSARSSPVLSEDPIRSHRTCLSLYGAISCNCRLSCS